MSYKDSFLFNSDKVGYRYKKVKAKIRRRRYRHRRRVFGRLKLRRLRKNDKLKVQWGAENNSNVWLFTNYFTPEVDTGESTVNPISTYNLISHKFKHALAFYNLNLKTTTTKMSFVATGSLTLPFKFYECTTLNYVFGNATAAVNTNNIKSKSRSKTSALLYLVMRLLKTETINFNNTSLLSLLGVIPSTYLKKLLSSSSTRYIAYFYNSNFALPSLNTKKVKR